jgi:hypothetical protein
MGERLAASHALRAAAKAKALEEEARARAERIAAARRQEELVGSDADDSEASDVDEADADEADDALASANGAAPLGSDLGDDDAGLATMAFGERLAAADEGAGGSAEEDDVLLDLDDDDGDLGLILDDVDDSLLARGVERLPADQLMDDEDLLGAPECAAAAGGAAGGSADEEDDAEDEEEVEEVEEDDETEADMLYTRPFTAEQTSIFIRNNTPTKSAGKSKRHRPTEAAAWSTIKRVPDLRSAMLAAGYSKKRTDAACRLKRGRFTHACILCHELLAIGCASAPRTRAPAS